MTRKLIVLAGMLIATFFVTLDTKPVEAGWRHGYRFRGGYGVRAGWRRSVIYGGYYAQPGIVYYYY